MEISNAASVAVSQVKQAGDKVTNAVDTATLVQKKVMDIQKQSATQLIESLPDPDSSLGHHVNVKV